MQLVRTMTTSARALHASVATIGNFDGVHVAHQAMIKYVVELSKVNHMPAVLINFEPTPKEHFLGDQAPARIYSFREKFEIIQSMGIDQFICLRFSETFAKMSANEFIHGILLNHLQIKHLIVGDDFRFGQGRQGDITLLRKMGKQLGFHVHDQNTVLHETNRVSSTLIREHLSKGDFTPASTLLGRPYTISGRVIHGEKKGRTIGFPTANILLKRQVSPLHGVFAVQAHNSSQHWNGIANIGKRPTVNGQRIQLEAHLFDCDMNLYGQRLHIKPLYKIRDEIKFASFSDLQIQIKQDAKQALEYFNTRT